MNDSFMTSGDRAPAKSRPRAELGVATFGRGWRRHERLFHDVQRHERPFHDIPPSKRDFAGALASGVMNESFMTLRLGAGDREPRGRCQAAPR